MARTDIARHGGDWRGKAGEARRGPVRLGPARTGEAGIARHGAEWQGPATPDEDGLGRARLERHGKDRTGTAGQCEDRRGWLADHRVNIDMRRDVQARGGNRHQGRYRNVDSSERTALVQLPIPGSVHAHYRVR